jgi:hypothetical protein
MILTSESKLSGLERTQNRTPANSRFLKIPNINILGEIESNSRKIEMGKNDEKKVEEVNNSSCC